MKLADAIPQVAAVLVNKQHLSCHHTPPNSYRVHILNILISCEVHGNMSWILGAQKLWHQRNSFCHVTPTPTLALSMVICQILSSEYYYRYWRRIISGSLSRNGRYSGNLQYAVWRWRNFGAGIRNGRLKVYFDASFLLQSSTVIDSILMSA